MPQKGFFPIFMVLIAFGLAITGVYLLTISKVPRAILMTDKITDKPVSSSRDEYLEALDKLKSIVIDKDPGAALDELNVMMENSYVVNRSCHALVHEIGHAAYQKYKDFPTAIGFQDGTCNSGFLHGVIEEHFKNSEAIFSEMKTICTGLDLGRCYHGVGHALMFYTGNDLPRSTQACEDAYGSTSGRGYCYEGVYMENFNTDQKLHPSDYLKADDPSYPCAEQASAQKPFCYYYAPQYYLSLYPDQYSQALNWCQSLDNAGKVSCVRGVGARLVKQNINRIEFVENECVNGSGEYLRSCIDGVVGFYMNNFDSYDSGVELCKKLSDRTRETCNTSVEARKVLFSYRSVGSGGVMGADFSGQQGWPSGSGENDIFVSDFFIDQ